MGIGPPAQSPPLDRVLLGHGKSAAELGVTCPLSGKKPLGLMVAARLALPGCSHVTPIGAVELRTKYVHGGAAQGAAAGIRARIQSVIDSATARLPA